MRFLIGFLATVLVLALVNWVACFFGVDVAGVISSPASSESNGHEGSSVPAESQLHH